METKTIVVEVESNLGSLKSQLKAAQAEVSAMSEKFGATSIEALNAAKAAAKLKDTIGDAKALTDAFNPDAKFKALTASMSGALNGFQAVEGAMGLFGAEGEAVQKTLLKVQSAMALAQGVDGLLEAQDAFKTFGATAINAFKGIATAIKANPLGLLITAITLATAAFVYLGTLSDGVAERIGKGFQASHKAVTDLNKEIEKRGAIPGVENPDASMMEKLTGKKEGWVGDYLDRKFGGKTADDTVTPSSAAIGNITPTPSKDIRVGDLARNPYETQVGNPQRPTSLTDLSRNPYDTQKGNYVPQTHAEAAGFIPSFGPKRPNTPSGDIVDQVHVPGLEAVEDQHALVARNGKIILAVRVQGIRHEAGHRVAHPRAIRNFCDDGH